MVNILWVEDDYYHVKGLIRPLEKEGYEFKIARSYTDAKKYLANWQDFSAIMLDLIIPYSVEELIDPNECTIYDPAENGIKLFYFIKNDLKVEIPIIIISIVKNTQIINELKKCGATKWLEKGNLLPKDLKFEIENLIGKNEIAAMD